MAGTHHHKGADASPLRRGAVDAGPDDAHVVTQRAHRFSDSLWVSNTPSESRTPHPLSKSQCSLCLQTYMLPELSGTGRATFIASAPGPSPLPPPASRPVHPSSSFRTSRASVLKGWPSPCASTRTFEPPLAGIGEDGRAVDILVEPDAGAGFGHDRCERPFTSIKSKLYRLKAPVFARVVLAHNASPRQPGPTPAPRWTAPIKGCLKVMHRTTRKPLRHV